MYWTCIGLLLERKSFLNIIDARDPISTSQYYTCNIHLGEGLEGLEVASWELFVRTGGGIFDSDHLPALDQAPQCHSHLCTPTWSMHGKAVRKILSQHSVGFSKINFKSLVSCSFFSPVSDKAVSF
jgi:hypothetical protein